MTPTATPDHPAPSEEMDPVLNRDLLADNDCFGCGHENHAGLRIEVRRDPDAADRLVASFTPAAHMVGFAGITHGGIIFTALDCLSTWTATLLGPNRHAGWLLRSARTTYHRPAHTGKPLSLHGWITECGGEWDPAMVHTEARSAGGELCVEADFKVVPLPPEKLTRVAGLRTLPENWRAFLSSGA